MGQSVVLKGVDTDDFGYNEALKTLRTNIQFCGSNNKVIMFSSAIPDEGKSDIAVRLSISMAQIGKRVLIIDADIRKSVLVARFQAEGEINGLSQFLIGQKKTEEVIYSTNISNLDIVFAGPSSPNPAELLEESLFEEFLEQSRKTYDFIIIDTPPMAELIDGAIVARRCDGVVLVIGEGEVSYRLEQRVIAQLEKCGCRILGAVLNKVKAEKNGYYGKYYDKSKDNYVHHKKSSSLAR